MDRRNLGMPVRSPSMTLERTIKIIQGRKYMKKTIIGLACALVAPLAFAQTSTQTTSTTYTAGTVTTYEPGKTVVVRGDQGPVSFALGTVARVVDGAGKIVTAPLRAGQKVRVYYTGPERERVVERVVVEDQ